MKRILLFLVLLTSCLFAGAQTTVKPNGTVTIAGGYLRNATTDSVYFEMAGSPKRYYNLGVYGKINKQLADSLVNYNKSIKSAYTVATLAEMQSYSGQATTIFWTDSLRGGLFNYWSSLNKSDGGIYFTAIGKGSGGWQRDISNAHGTHVNWFGAKGDWNLLTNTGTDNRLAIQACLDSRPNKNTAVIFDYGVYGSSDSLVVGEGTLIKGLSTLWPKQFFGDGSTIVNYKNMTAIKFYNNTNGFVTTLAAVNYRSQGIKFEGIGIFGTSRYNGKKGIVLRRTENSTIPVKTTGLSTTEYVYFSDWAVGADGSNSTDSWYVNFCHFADVKIGLIGGSGQTFINHSDFFKIDSIGGILNSSSEPDEIVSCEVETRFANTAAFIVNGRALISNSQFLTNKRSIVFNTTAGNSIVTGNHFHINSDDDITVNTAKHIQIQGNHFMSDYSNNTSYNYSFVLEPLNVNRRFIYATNTSAQISNNYFSKGNSAYIGNPVVIDNSTLAATNNTFIGFTYQDERQFNYSGTNNFLSTGTAGSQYVANKLTVGSTTEPTQVSIQGSGINAGIGLIRNLSDATTSSNLWFDNSGNTFRIYSDATGLHFRTGGTIGSGSGSSFPFDIDPTTGSSSLAYRMRGSAGGGYYELAAQSVNPANPNVGLLRMYTNSSSQLQWVSNSGVTNYLPNLKLPLIGLLKGNNTATDVSVAVAGTDYLTPSALSGYELLSNKQNSLTVDGTNTKYPTVTAVNAGLATKGPGTVTSLGKTDGVGIVSSVANPTTSPNHTIAVDTAGIRTVANSRTLAQTQTALNLKQNTVSLTTTGTSGAATFNPATGVLNIPTPSASTGTVTGLTATNNTGQTWTITSPTTTPNLSLALTSAAVGLGNVENKSSATIRGEITSGNITTGLGFTPYNSTNPSGYISSYTETDPTVPAYAKSLTTFNAIKTSTDALYEPLFTKNTAFNKSFGIAVGTVTEGNDSRVNNGQTAFSWGNHASAGYVPSTRTITINGVTYDLSANRSWTVSAGSGTVTSFGKVDGYGITSSITNATTTPIYTAAVDTTSATGLVSKSKLSSYAYTKTQTEARVFGVTGQSESGTYTPTISSTSNITSSSSNQFTWTRVGNIVTVFGRIGINATSTGTAAFYLSIPYGTILSNNDLNGNGSTQSDMGTGVYAQGDSSGNKAYVQVTITNASFGRDIHISFQYLHTSL